MNEDDAELGQASPRKYQLNSIRKLSEKSSRYSLNQNNLNVQSAILDFKNISPLGVNPIGKVQQTHSSEDVNARIISPAPKNSRMPTATVKSFTQHYLKQGPARHPFVGSLSSLL